MRGRKPRPLADRLHMMPRSCRRSPGAGHSPGSRSSGRGSSWASPPGNRSISGHPDSVRSARPSGGSAAATRTRDCPASWHDRTARATCPDFPPPARRDRRLACLEPIAEGLHITHWTSEDSGPPGRRRRHRGGHQCPDGPANPRRRGPATAPHPLLEDGPPGRAVQGAGGEVLWCYGNAERLARQGIWVVCVDEKPNLQVLEREPDPASHPRLDRATGV